MTQETDINTGSSPAVPLVRVGFQLPTSEFRMHCKEECKPAYIRGEDHFKIWTLEAGISVAEHRKFTDIPSGTWTFSIQRTTQRNAPNPNCKKYSEERTAVFVTPSANILNDWQKAKRDLQLEFFVGFDKIARFYKSSSGISKGSGVLKNGEWKCCPAAVKEWSLFSHDNTLVKENLWSVDLYFHVESAGKNTGQIYEGLTDSLLGICKSGQFSDFKLISAEGKTFPVHRLTLASQSGFFAAMLAHDMLENSTGVCHNPDISSDILEIVLAFLYGRTVSGDLESKAEEVLAAAHKLQIQDLVNVCENLLIVGVNRDNAFRHMGISVKYGLDKLMKKAAKCVAD